MGRTSSGGSLDHLRYIKENNVYDPLLKMVISNMRRYKWVEFYGLNLKETMGLDFHDYNLMIDELIKYQEQIDNAVPDALNKLNQQYNN